MWNGEILLTLAYYFALFFTPIIIHVLLFEENKNKNSRYKTPDWYYVPKRFLAIPTIKKLKQKCRKSQLALDEELQEQPRNLTSSKQNDTQIIYGIDQEGNSIFLKIILRQHRIAEVILCLRLNNGKAYRLPNEPQVLLCSIPSRQWRAEGLTIMVVEPLHRIRITYNGLLRDISVENGKVEHVKFNFIWNAADKPVYYPQDVPNSLLADALAKEPWRNGRWIDLMGDERGYEQYGALQGFVAGEAFPDEITLYLPSFRKRYWGTAENLALQREFSVFLVAEDGTLFNIGARSYKTGCSQLKYGSTLNSIGNIYTIDQHDINLEYIGEHNIPDVLTIHLKGNGKTHKCILHINPKTNTTTYSNALKGWELKTVFAESIIDSQQAKAIVCFWYSRNGTGVDLPNPLLTEPKIDIVQANFVAPLSSRECSITGLSGGKGSSLALLSSLNSKNFIVPQGFVLLSNAFKYQLEQNSKLKIAVLDLEDVCRGKIKKDLSIACKETTDLFRGEPVCPELTNVILKELDEIRKTSKSNDGIWRWAVRSSGLNEDSEEQSAAGQNETFLGCTTKEDILNAVSACWGSLFAFQSVQYRRQLGLDINCSMGVVIQRMVPSETAGVLFTCHPTTGDPSKMVITANYGLGESVVSGQADPDTIILRRTWEGKLSLHSQEIGLKKVIVKMCDDTNENSGVTVSDVSSDVAKNLSLTEEQALLLGKAGLELERAYGSPRDIEWAFHENKLYLLQSRPITTLNTWTDFELLHEFDMPVLTNQEVMTVANVAEVMPGALTPLSNSITNKAVSANLYKYIMETNEEPFNMKFTGSIKHHCVINVTNCFLNKLEDKISTAMKVVDMAVFGHPVTDEKIHSVGKARFGVMSRFEKLRMLLKSIIEAFKNESNVKQATKLACNFKFHLGERKTALEKLNTIKDAISKIEQGFDYHGKTTKISIFYQIISLNILAEGSNELTTDHYYDMALLLSSCSNVVSAEVPKALESITNIIQKADISEKFIRVNPKDGINWLKLNCVKAGQELDNFLEKHGHRGLREFEFKEDSWEMNPGIIIEMLQVNCKGKTITRTVENLSVDDTIAKLVTPKNENIRKVMKFLVRKCRNAVCKREETKSEVVRMVNETRIAFRELAKQMVLEGIIPDPQLIYFFSLYELEQVIQNRDSPLIRKAMQRQRLYPRWDKLKLPELIFGFYKLEEDNNIKSLLRNNENNIQLKGTPACPGDVVARACVITDLKDIDQLQAGDILITYATDIGWSPYFPILAAVVTELGGLISHGAVVAREYGLPCVVGVQNATAVFKTGDTVHLSGKTGILELVKSSGKGNEVTS